MSGDKPKQKNNTELLVGYYFVLAVFVTGAFFPEARIWGFNYFAYLPAWTKLTILAVCTIFPVVILASKFDPLKNIENSNRQFWLVASLGSLGLISLFYFLRAQSFYLGDGYALLSLLEADNPLVKTREIGEAWSHIWVKNLIGGDPKEAALLSYQIISIGAGTLFLLISAFFSHKFFERNVDRSMFFLGLISGGYMLLFFGYVENYSLFVLSVLLFCCFGMMIVQGQWSRWLAMPLVGLCVLMHIFGIVLVPAAIFLLVSKSRLGNKLVNLSGKTKWLLVVLGVIPIAFTFFYYYTNSYFFRFALLPLFEDRFTVDGYTLFSFNHLVDFFNLLMILIPAIPLLLLVISKKKLYDSIKKPEFLFLAIASTSALGTAFVFDPKLGMARDWDLFSFAGVPLVMLLFYTLLKVSPVSPKRMPGLAITLVLCFVGLTARATVIGDKESGYRQFVNLIHLDHTRNRNSHLLRVNYYSEKDLSSKARDVHRSWMESYPEIDLYIRGAELAEIGKYTEAIKLLDSATHLSPFFFEAWLDLGKTYGAIGNSSMGLKCSFVTEGLNPYSSLNLINQGSLYMGQGNPEKAREVLERAISFNPTAGEAYCNLLWVYKKLGMHNKYQDCLNNMIDHAFFDRPTLHMAVSLLSRVNDFRSASILIDKTLSSGIIDSTFVSELLKEFPRLKQ